MSSPVVFQASRFTRGNKIFPDRLRLEGDAAVFVKRRLVGGEEESIRYEQIASVSVERGVFFSDLLFETTGGSEPVFLNGLWNGDAQRARAQLQVRLKTHVHSKDEMMVELLTEQNRLLREISAKLDKA
mgnify:CR=1 FL=1